MTCAVMQPYFFPYIGYWQLLASVDLFVIYDDVNYIKQGYINKNTILSHNGAQNIRLEILGASSNTKIKNLEVGNKNAKFLKTIKQNYIKAPYFKEVYPMIERVLLSGEKNLSIFLKNTIVEVMNYLNIETQIFFSSTIKKPQNLQGEEKLLFLLKEIGADEYYNSIGGRNLYSKETFLKQNIKLSFLKSKEMAYKQFSKEFVAHLSIIDVMMFNSKKEVQKMLQRYELV